MHIQAQHGNQIRKYKHSDIPVLAKIYRDSIRHLGPVSYTSEQIAAWSSFPDDVEEFRRWLSHAHTLVAVGHDNIPIAFGGIEDRGRISSLFVSPDLMRQRLGSTLLERLVEEARLKGIETLTTEASEFSKPLFVKYGFCVSEIEHTEFKGVQFSRYAMYKCL